MIYKFKLAVVSSVAALLVSGCAAPSSLVSDAGYVMNTSSPSVVSWHSQRTSRIVMQEHDYSCGAAALATMMTYYFGDEVSELELLADVERLFNDDEKLVIQAAGLSLAELEMIARKRGYQSAAIDLDSAALATLPGPIIIFLRTDDYRHFAVLREVVNGRARIADPSRGNLSMTVAELLEVWRGETLVLGREGFGVPKVHRLQSEVRANADRRYLKILPPRRSPFMRVPR